MLLFERLLPVRREGVLPAGATIAGPGLRVLRSDPDFVERYLNDGDVDPHDLHAPLEEALRQGHLVPICFTSARNGAGGLREGAERA